MIESARGLVWEIPRVNSLGDIIHIQIMDYVVIETLPASSKPEALYRIQKPDDEPG